LRFEVDQQPKTVLYYLHRVHQWF